MKCIAIEVYGKVQGVWFRASTQNKALELGICGIVKNQSDGSVYIEAEGSELMLEKLVNWCKEGPIHAQVKNVQHRVIDKKMFSSFECV